jgi:hypothetical protein
MILRNGPLEILDEIMEVVFNPPRLWPEFTEAHNAFRNAFLSIFQDIKDIDLRNKCAQAIIEHDSMDVFG